MQLRCAKTAEQIDVLVEMEVLILQRQRSQQQQQQQQQQQISTQGTSLLRYDVTMAKLLWPFVSFCLSLPFYFIFHLLTGYFIAYSFVVFAC